MDKKIIKRKYKIEMEITVSNEFADNVDYDFLDKNFIDSIIENNLERSMCVDSCDNVEITELDHTNVYDRKYGDDRKCKCGHSYYRHFDSYEDMEPVGCKYCGCFEFEEDQNV